MAHATPSSSHEAVTSSAAARAIRWPPAELLEDTDAQRAVDILKGNPCDQRGTSCADQLAQAVEQALAQEGQ